MAYIQRTFECPGAKVVTKYYATRVGGPKTRIPNWKKTTDQQKKINARNSVNHLAELIATNFKEDDMRIDLTYAGEPPTPEEAEKELNCFLDRCRRLYKKAGIPFKWVLVTEYQAESKRKKNAKVRIHHHLLMNHEKGKVEFSDIRPLWHRARLNFHSMRCYDGTYDDACALASYLVKETSETYSQEGAIQKRRYRTSRNLVQPLVKKEIIHSTRWTKKPRAPQGFTVASVYESYTVEGFPMQKITMVKDMGQSDWEEWKEKISKTLRRRRKKGKHGKR